MSREPQDPQPGAAAAQETGSPPRGVPFNWYLRDTGPQRGRGAGLSVQGVESLDANRTHTLEELDEGLSGLGWG